MDEKLRRYVEGLFNDVPMTKSVVELKEEMIQNLKEKFEDLIKEGKSEETAYNIAIAGIGDISTLLNDMDRDKRELKYEDKQKSAALTSISVMIYILSLIPIIFAMEFSTPIFGLIGFLFMITIATGILIYNSMTKPKFNRTEDTMVEEFKEWQKDRTNKRMLRVSISFALWSMIIALYFIISFTTFAWHITWVIFIVAIAIEALLNIFFIIRK